MAKHSFDIPIKGLQSDGKVSAQVTQQVQTHHRIFFNTSTIIIIIITIIIMTIDKVILITTIILFFIFIFIIIVIVIIIIIIIIITAMVFRSRSARTSFRPCCDTTIRILNGGGD